MPPLLGQACGDDLLAVVLFGSVARGTPPACSDTDWLVVLRQRSAEPRKDHRACQEARRALAPEWVAAAETGLLSEPHFHLRSAAEAEQGGPLFLDLCNDGHLLHDPDGLAARFMAEHSQWLRAQRELAFYGDVEWIPTERHGPLEGERALAAAREALDLAELVIAGP